MLAGPRVFSSYDLIYFFKLSKQYIFIGESISIYLAYLNIFSEEQRGIENTNSSATVKFPSTVCRCHNKETAQTRGFLVNQAGDFFHMGEVFCHHGGLQATPTRFVFAAPSLHPDQLPPTQLSFWSKECDSSSAASSSHSQFFLHPPHVMDDIHIHTHSQRLNPILSKPGKIFAGNGSQW